jgi:hypothetical protein
VLHGIVIDDLLINDDPHRLRFANYPDIRPAR